MMHTSRPYARYAREMRKLQEPPSMLVSFAHALFALLCYLLAGAIPVLGATVGWWLPLLWS